MTKLSCAEVGVGWGAATGASAFGATACAAGVAAGAGAAPGAGVVPEAAGAASSLVPSTMMPVPQCLHVIFTFLPRTFSSGSAYLAEQDVQLTFMKLPGGRSNAARRERARPQSWRNTTRS